MVTTENPDNTGMNEIPKADSSLEAARQLIEAVKKQFEQENAKLREYRDEIYREKDFKVSKFYTYYGPNYYLNAQAVVFNIFIAPSGDTVEFFRKQIEPHFPAIATIETPFVIDLFAETLKLVLKMDIDLFINKHSISCDEDDYIVAVEFLDKTITKEAIYLVADWFRSISQDLPFNFPKEYSELQTAFGKTLFGGPTLYSLIAAGNRLNIPVFFLFEENEFQWGYGKKQLRGRSTTFHTDSIKDTEFTMYKDMVGDFLTMCGFPTPQGVNCFEEEQILVEAQKIGFPVVVKPVAGHKGQGVTTGINTLEEVLYAFRKITTAAKLEGVAFDGALVQQQVYGTDHRLLSVNGKFVAALERVPAYVDGDGINTIESLIATENQKLIRLDNARSPLCKIKIDDNLNEFLKIQNLTLYSVPKAGERITLRRVANISAGGVSINVTDKIHPDNIKLVEDIASYFKVKCLGIDVLAEDISKPWTEGNFGIIEINAGPGVFMHLAPAYGGSVDVPKFIMESHFIKDGYSRIPIIAGNNLSLNFSQLLLEKVKSIKPDIFYASLTEEGVYFNGLPFHKNEDHDQNVKIILRHPKCEFAVFSHTTDDILDFGTFHSGADIVILDEATKTEELTMLDQLLPGGLLIQIIDKNITLTQNDAEIKSTDFINDADLDQKLITMIEPYLKELVSKYE